MAQQKQIICPQIAVVTSREQENFKNGQVIQEVS